MKLGVPRAVSLLAVCLTASLSLMTGTLYAATSHRPVYRFDTIQGQVLDAASEPATGVTVTLLGDKLALPKSTQTDTHGGFVLPSVPAGRYTVLVDGGVKGRLERQFLFQHGPVAGVTLSLHLGHESGTGQGQRDSATMALRRTNPTQLFRPAAAAVQPAAPLPRASFPVQPGKAQPKALAVSQNVNAAADITISSNVIAPNPVRFGFNISPGDPSGILDNHVVAAGGMTPYDARQAINATADGTDTTFIGDDTGIGTDYFASIVSGYFVGAQARVYRYANGAWSLVRTGTISGYTAVSGSKDPADHTITFSTPGAVTKSGDVIWISKDGVPEVPNVNGLDPRFTEYDTAWSTEVGKSTRQTPIPAYSLDSTYPPEDNDNGPGGAPRLSLKLSDSNTETQGIWQYEQPQYLGTQDGFDTGHTYEVSLWLKQEGVADGSLTFKFTGFNITHTFTGITSEWKKFTWDFPGAPNLPAGSVVPTVRFDFNAPGTMWYDNVKIYDITDGRKPDTWDPRALSAFQAFKPATLRIWSNFASSAGNYQFFSLDSWLADEEDGRSSPGIGNLYETSEDLEHLPTSLAYAKQIGADPWIIASMSLSEQEWSNLIDYLAAPAGQGYAAFRPANHPGPYTADFNRIYLEFGNEEWGTQYTPVNGQYGQWLHYMLSQAIAGKSYFDPNKIKLVGNGFTAIPSLASTYSAATPETTVFDYFSYASGDTNLAGDAFLQSDLLALPTTNKAWFDNIVAQEKADAAAGHGYELAVYEGGPGADAPSHEGDTTLASGVMTLDVFLYGSSVGFGAQNYFEFNIGNGPYSSHSTFNTGLIPHPAWEALQLRNQYANGPMVQTTANSVPVTDDKNKYPLIGSYAFHDTSNGSDVAEVFVVSRDLNNTTPVTLHFPADPTGSATLYALTGDPRATNDTALNVPVTNSTVTVTRDYTFNMPPGSAYLFVVPTGAWAAPTTLGTPSGLTATAGDGQVTLNWTAAANAASYNVYQGTSAGGEGATAVKTGIAANSTTITGLTNGTAYYFTVKAVNTTATSDASNEASATPAAAGSGGGTTTLAYEPFNVPAGALNGVNDGNGWASGWVEQSGSTDVPGYNVATGSALTAGSLTTLGNHAVGGFSYQTAGRPIDISSGGPFASLLSNGLIGATGTTVWESVLLRKDTASGDPLWISLQPSTIPWATGSSQVSVGYFGGSGTQYWALNVNGTIYPTTTQVVVGQTVELVTSIAFGPTNTVNLYVNPASGASAPTTPDATATTTDSIAFRSLSFQAGYGPGSGSLDEIRLDTSFANVTPTK